MGRLPGASLAPHLVLQFVLLLVALSSVNGQVYVNPEAPRAASTASQASNGNENLLTQTVYGFLDFTTTIGSTIMVFSPQSAPAAEPPKVEASSEPVIETRPPADAIPPTAIHASKTTVVEVTSSSGKESSPPATPPAAPKTTPEPKVTTPKATTPKTIPTTPKAAPTTPKTVPTTPKTVPTTPKTVPTTPKTVPTTPKAAPTPSAVKRNEAEGLPPVILSSIVEVRTAEGPTPPAEDSDGGAANQVGAEFYNFLSRQPSEVVEETFKVIGLKPSSKVNVRSKTRQSVEVRSRVNVVTQTDVKTRLSSAVHSSKSRPGKAHSKARAHHHHDDDPYPTGLVTRMGGTMVADGITTVHETSVVGTIISGKYAQILQSTSHIFSRKAPAPSPSQQRILKTAAPEINATPVDAPDARTQITFSPSQRRPHRTDFLSKLNRARPSAGVSRDPPEERKKPAAAKPVGRSSSRPSVRAAKTYSNPRFGRTSTSSELATVSIFSDPPPRSSSTSGGRRFSRSRSGGFRPTAAATAAPVSTTAYYRNEPEAPSYGSGRRGGFKPRNHYSQAPQSSHHDHHGIHASGAAASAPTTSLYKFKLARPTGRWQYKTSPKPRISIRRQSEEEEAAAASAFEEDVVEEDEVEGVPGAVKKVVTVVTSGEAVVEDDVHHATPAPSTSSSTATTLTEETINVEISTPADFKNTYYEIATIKSPYTFQVGTVKNTRFITVTSTHSRNLDSTSTASPSLSTEPLTENILGATATQPLRYENLLPDASIATLPAVTLTDPSMPTPPLETMTETFNTTQLLLKTHVLPVVRMYDGDTNILETATTSHMTLVQSYHVTRLVTAIKTLPPSELFHFVASKRLKEFNAKLEEAGSELLESELEVGENDSEDDDPALLVLPPDLDLANVGSEFDVTAAERARRPTPTTPSSTAVAVTSSTALGTPQLSPEQLQQLALLRLLNPAAAPQVLTTSRPVLKLETLYESHVIPVWNGATTLFSTISRPIATVSKTEYEYGTTAALPSAVIPPPPQPLIPNNPFLPQPQFTITSQPVVQQTVVTSTDSKILKLTFGAKTVYSTLYSTKVVPTVVTTYVTTSAPVAPVVAPAFPGYFPGGYAGFPAFVG